MQATTGSEGGTVVDWEVRREVLAELAVVPLRVKVDLLMGLLMAGTQRGKGGEQTRDAAGERALRG